MRTFYIIFSLVTMTCLFSCSGKPKLEVKMPDKYDGQSLEIINYLDSTVLAHSDIVNGHASLSLPEGEPKFAAISIDGRIRAFYITESGTAFLADSLASAYGTPLNNKFTRLLNSLDSVEQYDDMELYLDFVTQSYNENRDNPIGEYFGLELLRYAEPEKVDSILEGAPEALKMSSKAQYYQKLAQIRKDTSPGKEYVDFSGEDASGNEIKLSSLLTPDSYTLIDFWASWCPYCIKELPELKALNEKWKDNKFQIIGVAVRDLPEDTKASVNKFDIPWSVIYNVQRRPYELYGFTGIPHHILIGPDGKIISRGENTAEIDKRLSDIFFTE